MAEILVADDEEIIRELLSTSLTRLGHQVKICRNGTDALEAFGSGKFDLVISDYKMPGLNGLELAEKILAVEAGASIILMTAYGTIETAVKAIRMGVHDFIEKPFEIDILEHTVEQSLQFRNLKRENRNLREALKDRHLFVGAAPGVVQLLFQLSEVATSNSTVLITGESGTGKELLAQAIHNQSRRAGLPFVKINCAAIPESLVESELFGHEKGAFTSAIKSRMGKFELANGGTLLLDEIGEMPLHAQAKLLRVLQEREVTKIGGDQEVPVDVRVICTTNRDLKSEVAKGTFREDLFYRLNVIPLRSPPLRERLEDLNVLALHFMKKYNRENGYTVPGIGLAALEKLKKHSWPGNVRELENVIQRAVVFAKSKEISVDHLRLDEDEKPVIRSDSLSAGMTVAEAERNLILKTLEATLQNRTQAAEMLGISIRTLRNKLHEYKLHSDLQTD